MRLGYHTELRPATRASVVLLAARPQHGALRPGGGWRRSEWDNGGSKQGWRSACGRGQRWAARPGDEVIACHECGTVHRLPAMGDDTIARCTACDARIFIRFEQSVDPHARALSRRAVPVPGRQLVPDHRHVARGPAQRSHGAGQRQGALRRQHVAAGAGGGAGRGCAAAGQDPGHAGDTGPAAAGVQAALARVGLPLGGAPAALVDDGSLPAGHNRRLREAAGSGDDPSGDRDLRLRRHHRDPGSRRRPFRPARDLAPAGGAGDYGCARPRARAPR